MSHLSKIVKAALPNSLKKIIRSKLLNPIKLKKLNKVLALDDFNIEYSIENYGEFSYFERLNLFYNHIRKSGNSNIFFLIFHLLKDNGIILKIDPALNSLRDPLPAFMRDNYLGILKYPLNKNLGKNIEKSYKFTFVRNPYIRTVSMFRDKIIKQKYFANQFINIMDNIEGFQRFVTFLEEGGVKKDKHFETQMNHLFFKPQYFDFIGRLEKFSSDFMTMVDSLSINISTETKDLILKRKNTNHITQSETYYKNYYNNDIADRVYKIYYEDFINFNYDKEWSSDKS